MTNVQHTHDNTHYGATWRGQCARLSRTLAPERAAVVIAEASGDAVGCATRREQCVRLNRELAKVCADCFTVEKCGDASRAAIHLAQCARLFLQLKAECSAGVSAEVFGDDSLTRKLLKKAFALGGEALDSGDTSSGATWREQNTRLSLLKVYANAACLAAEAFGDKSAEDMAHVAWGDAEDALRRLTEQHLPEIEASYDEIWAALEAERRSALCSTTQARSRARPPAQLRSRARRPRRSRPRRPSSSSSDSDGEGPGARRERGAPAAQTIATRSEERTRP